MSLLQAIANPRNLGSRPLCCWSLWADWCGGCGMQEIVESYVKRVRELAEHVRGNEQATKQSLIGPLFTMLGYDLTDPRECVPEFKADFGKERSVKPVDWAFYLNGRPIFLVRGKGRGQKAWGLR